MFRTGAAALAAWAVVAIVPAEAGISEDLKFCAALKSSKERLACYDAAARIEGTSAARVARPVEPVSAVAVNTAPSAMDAHAAVVPRTPAAALASWQGFYVGANGGWAKADLGSSKGWLAGGQIGYNAQIGEIVIGVVADIAAADVKRSETTTLSSLGFLTYQRTESAKVDLFGTARAKIGFDLGGTGLVYATGGLAWAQNRLTIENAKLIPPVESTKISEQHWHFGFAAGAGAEVKFDQRWSVFAEYLYVRLEPQDYNFGFPGAGVSVSGNFHVARGGVSYWFK